MTLHLAKQSVGDAAAALIEPHQVVGLGSGTTSEYFIKALGKRVKEGLAIKAIASSFPSQELAKKWKIPLVDFSEISYIDITVDGADEVDEKNRMIKGGGGAHVREKILAAFSHRMIVIVDETKLTPSVGRGKLPVEILSFGAIATQKKIEALGYLGSFRKTIDGSLYVTENGNFLYDITFPQLPLEPEKDHITLVSIPGVVDTGFFFGYGSLLLIGYMNGLVERKHMPPHPLVERKHEL